jgi:hypothetical protein
LPKSITKIKGKQTLTHPTDSICPSKKILHFSRIHIGQHQPRRSYFILLDKQLVLADVESVAATTVPQRSLLVAFERATLVALGAAHSPAWSAPLTLTGVADEIACAS